MFNLLKSDDLPTASDHEKRDRNIEMDREDEIKIRPAIIYLVRNKLTPTLDRILTTIRERDPDFKWLKGFVARNNHNDTLTAIEQLVTVRRQQLGAASWSKAVAHSDKFAVSYEVADEADEVDETDAEGAEAAQQEGDNDASVVDDVSVDVEEEEEQEERCHDASAVDYLDANVDEAVAAMLADAGVSAVNAGVSAVDAGVSAVDAGVSAVDAVGVADSNEGGTSLYGYLQGFLSSFR
jgi:hypothetical protein